MSDFTPKIRMVVMSDIHTKKNKDCIELSRLRKGLDFAYSYAENSEYKKIDAFVAVGDFVDRGSEEEFLNFKEVLDEKLKPETSVTLFMASHEYSEGEDAAKEKLQRIFGMHYFAHKVINGFHLIGVSCTNGCRFKDAEREFTANALKEASSNSLQKPIFFFQHPHVQDTVYGSICWGDDGLYEILSNYPQIITFSGHSHCPINDPRSVHQEYFTSFGTGSLSYFEMDEFGKLGGTIPSDKNECAQYLIVEADESNRVRVYPVDILTKKFFRDPWEIDAPSDPSTYIYTSRRALEEKPSHFDSDAFITAEKTKNGVKLVFSQAKGDERVNDYIIRLKNENGAIVKQASVWSHYYLFDMPETVSAEIKDVAAGRYTVEITARGFWKTPSDNRLEADIEI